jgi:hypothetical protein
MHNGKRIADAEYFDDVLESGGIGGTGNAGILNSAGLDDYDSVKERTLPDGIEVSVNCRMCNSKRGIVLEWPELYQIGSNNPGLPPLIPPGWRFSPNNGSALFVTGCPVCGRNGLAIHITPDEARRKVESAVAAGLVAPQAIQQWRANVARIRGQYPR